MQLSNLNILMINFIMATNQILRWINLDSKESQQLGIKMATLRGSEECYQILNFRIIKKAKSYRGIIKIMIRATGGIIL